MHKEIDKAFSIHTVMTALCCLAHFATHLGPADFRAPSWWLAVGVLIAACAALAHASLARFLVLAGLQVLHIIADAPFNPDHWLLLFFVNVVVLCSAFDLWLRQGSVDPGQLYEQFAPAARVVFLVCYGFAALSKFNTHFLGAASSCATELAEIQIYVSPWLGHIAWPAVSGWITAVCESFVWWLLLAPSTRRYGIMLGMLFHTVLVVSPAIAVFDFSMAIYTMLFLFAPRDFPARVHDRIAAARDQMPAVFQLLRTVKLPALVAIGIFMIGRSSAGLPLYGNPRISTINWLVNMMIASIVIGLAALSLFGRPRSAREGTFFRPKLLSHLAMILVAVLNGLCPYLGLKTQGSFTMFSNLRTEAGHWNHVIMPPSMRWFAGFQDDLVQIARIDDKRIQHDFVDGHYLVPSFEVRRAAARNPGMKLTVIRGGHEIELDPVSLDSHLAKPPSWIARKLLLFRPVTADGSPYCGN